MDPRGDSTSRSVSVEVQDRRVRSQGRGNERFSLKNVGRSWEHPGSEKWFGEREPRTKGDIVCTCNHQVHGFEGYVDQVSPASS